MGKHTIARSAIEGNGLFASGAIGKNEVIGVAAFYNPARPMITDDLGRYVNHSGSPNSRLRLEGDEYLLVANEDISSGDEIVADYGLTPWFMEKPKEHFR